MATDQRAARGVPILMYHEVAPADRIDALTRLIQRGYICSDEEFEAQMRSLAEKGFRALSLDQLASAVRGEAAWPDKGVVITFDDGYEGNHRHARPILKKYGLHATFFIVTNKIGDDSMMSWEQLKDMCDDGFHVQSHTANHPLLSTLDSNATLAELRDSKEAIEGRLSHAVRSLSRPNGHTNEHLRDHVTRLGYATVCGSTFGFNDRGADLLDLRRIAVKGGAPLQKFDNIVTQHPGTMRRLRWQSALKTGVARTLGKKNYDRLYNAVFGVQEQDKRKQTR
jgi:peptidoglycan/xylan/chitin deacetylase (PgdA/CDA1 family)